MEHRQPGVGVGVGCGVIGMDTHSARVGRRIADRRAVSPDPVHTPEHLDLVDTRLLIGGDPGSGKSRLFDLLAVHEALSHDGAADDGAIGVGRTGAVG